MQSILKSFTAGLLFVLFFVSSISCGGGGGGAEGATVGASVGNSLPPSTGVGDVENLFPNVQGTSWNYSATVTNPTSGNPSNYIDSVTVTGTKTIGGQTASVFLESNPSGSGIPIEGYYFKNAGGVAFLGTNDVMDTLNAGIVPYIVGLFPVTPGVVAHVDKNGVDFGHDLDGDGINETMNLTLTSTINGFEPLTIGIGSFARTLKNTEELTGAVVSSKLRTSVPFSSTAMRWSAPGIGVIKTSQSMTVQTTTTGETMEIRGYVTNGVAHGFGLPYLVASNLAPGDSDYYNPGPPALATDGQNFLAVNANTAGTRGMLFDSAGKPINSASLAGGVRPIAAFDGNNYWVFNIHRNSTSGSTDTCLAQRVSPAGILIDATAINLLTVDVNRFSGISTTGFAFGNTNGLLAYSAYNLSTGAHELYGVLVNKNGTFSASFPIATDNSTHVNPSVAFDGTNFFVTWDQSPTNWAAVGGIYGVRISAAGSVIDSAPIAISSTPNGNYGPRVAFDGTNYLVVWLDLRNQTTATAVPYPDIYGARITTAGILLDGPATTGGFPINSGGTIQRYSPYVAFTGTEYLITWATLGYANTGSPGIQAARISTSGALPSGANMAISVSGPPTAATFSQFVFPVITAGSQRAAVVWLNNTESSSAQKAFLGASFFPF